MPDWHATTASRDVIKRLPIQEIPVCPLHEAIVDGEIATGKDASVEARHLVNAITGISTAALHNRSMYTREFLAGEVDMLVAQFTSHN